MAPDIPDRGNTTRFIPVGKCVLFRLKISRILLLARLRDTAPPNLLDAMIPIFGGTVGSSVFINCNQKCLSLSLRPFFLTARNSWDFRSLESCEKHWLEDFKEGVDFLLFSGIDELRKRSVWHGLYDGDF